jgi:hypothetical protein
VAEAGTELFKDSVTMWQMKLQVLIDSKSPDIATLFEEAFVHLKPQVCELGLSYFFMCGKPFKTLVNTHLECTCLIRAYPRITFVVKWQ